MALHGTYYKCNSEHVARVRRKTGLLMKKKYQNLIPYDLKKIS